MVSSSPLGISLSRVRARWACFMSRRMIPPLAWLTFAIGSPVAKCVISEISNDSYGFPQRTTGKEIINLDPGVSLVAGAVLENLALTCKLIIYLQVDHLQLTSVKAEQYLDRGWQCLNVLTGSQRGSWPLPNSPGRGQVSIDPDGGCRGKFMIGAYSANPIPGILFVGWFALAFIPF